MTLHVQNKQLLLIGLTCLAIMTVLYMSRLNYIPVLSIYTNEAGKASLRPPVPASIKLISSRNQHTIVVFNPTYWVPLKLFNEVLSNQCVYNNCVLSRNRSNLVNQSAIMYILTEAPSLPKIPPLLPSERRPDQAWIFYWVEAPPSHAGNGYAYKNIHWRSAVNWTMTYTLDADISVPYGRLEKRHPPVRNYSAIFRRKTKMVAWAVGHCKTASERERYVQELRSHGVSIDIFGKCTGNRMQRDALRDMINTTYMFYLGFENTICKDYVTEKFFAYFQLDVIVVVRGAANYSNMLPNNSYINTADFRSAKDLAEYLRVLASDEKRYTNYLRNKDHFVSYDVATGVRNASFCNMCEKLNNLDRNRRTYTDFVQNIFNGTCTKPRDISNITSRQSVFKKQIIN